MSNGLVEWLHRQLKASIKSYPYPERWADALPLTLLGICNSLKEDIGSTYSELVSTLRLPGEFFVRAMTSSILTLAVMSWSSSVLCNLCVLRTPVCILLLNLASVLTCSRHLMYLCIIAVRKPLQLPYFCPFKVLRRTDKYFLLDLNGRQDTVLVDRLKVAHLDPSTTVTWLPSNSNSSSSDTATPLPTLQPPIPSTTHTTRSLVH